MPIGRIVFTRRLFHWWYRRKQASEQKQLRSLEKQLRDKVEELKKQTQYYSTRDLLERYDEKLRKNVSACLGPSWCESEPAACRARSVGNQEWQHRDPQVHANAVPEVFHQRPAVDPCSRPLGKPRERVRLVRSESARLAAEDGRTGLQMFCLEAMKRGQRTNTRSSAASASRTTVSSCRRSSTSSVSPAKLLDDLLGRS